MKDTTKLKNPKSKMAKFRVGDLAQVCYTYSDDSKILRAHVGLVGVVLGRTDYGGTPGNRYYLRFSDGYVGGYESYLLKKTEVMGTDGTLRPRTHAECLELASSI